MPFFATDTEFYAANDILQSAIAATEEYGSQSLPEFDIEPFHTIEHDNPESDVAETDFDALHQALELSGDPVEKDSKDEAVPMASSTPSKPRRGRPAKDTKQNTSQRHSTRIQKSQPTGRAATRGTKPTLKSTPAPRKGRGRPRLGSMQSTESTSKRGRGRPQHDASQAEKPTKASGKEWEVEKIIDSQVDSDSFEHFYKVKWKGYSDKESTWEPKKNLTHCRQAIEAYEAGKQKRK